MGTETKLAAERREGTGKGVARKLRQAGKVPAVMYGGGEEPVSITLDGHDTTLLFQSISIENTVIQLQVEGEKGAVSTLVRDVQMHPFRPEIRHVDFLRLEKGVEVELSVPVTLEGTAKGVRDESGVMDQLIYELPVRCIPSAIPEAFVVDVTDLDIGDTIRVGEIEMPKGVTLLADPEQGLVAVHPPRLEEEEDEAETAEGEEAPSAADDAGSDDAAGDASSSAED